MYNEDSYSRNLLWIKIKRIAFMVLFSILGCLLGVLISIYVIDVLELAPIYRIVIITVSTLLFFFISTAATANTGKEIQDGYWRIAVLRKLTLISKKLDSIENIEKILSNEDIENLRNLK